MPDPSIRNIVVAGEIRVGKSSLINLITGLTGSDACVTGNLVRGTTIETRSYDWNFDEQTYRLWDTPGLSQDSGRKLLPEQARGELRSLLVTLRKNGGIHLILHCIGGEDGVTDDTQQAYNTIVEVRNNVASSDIPLAAVITELENQSTTSDAMQSMEKWWNTNADALSSKNMSFVGHACITCSPDDDEPQVPGRRELCQGLVRDLIVQQSLLPRTPPPDGLHIVLFGETGVGKSSLVNLLAGQQIALVSPDCTPCTLDASEYQFQLGSTTIRLWDTVGLEEPEKGQGNGYVGAIEKAVRLIQRLNEMGGISLFLFCIRGNRATDTVQSNYRLFYEVLGKGQVPIALAVTHLEREARMEDWWDRNGRALEKKGIRSTGHACVTTLENDDKSIESRDALRELLARFDEQGKFSMPSEAWIGRILKELSSFFKKPAGFPRGKELVNVLTKRCGLRAEVAQRVAICIDSDSS